MNGNLLTLVEEIPKYNKGAIIVVEGSEQVIDNETYSSINRGYMILVGIDINDTEEDVEKMVNKLIKFRINPDENDKINLSIKDINGEILSISQFTLLANAKKANRPGFENAMKGEPAKHLYEYFNHLLEKEGITVKTGVFGADMKIHLINDGPLTFTLDSKEDL